MGSSPHLRGSRPPASPDVRPTPALRSLGLAWRQRSFFLATWGRAGQGEGRRASRSNISMANEPLGPARRAPAHQRVPGAPPLPPCRRSKSIHRSGWGWPESGVVDQHIATAEPIRGGGAELLDTLSRGKISGDGHHLSTETPKFRLHALQRARKSTTVGRLVRASTGDNHGRPPLGKSNGHGLADSACRASNDNYLAHKVSHESRSISPHSPLNCGSCLS
jgi:hypothetical protein